MSKPNGRRPVDPDERKAPLPPPPPRPPAKLPEDPDKAKKSEKAVVVEVLPSATTPSVPPGPSGPDALKTQMPTGEVGVRNPPGLTLASGSGGTSKAEDTSRAAGYVADLTKANEPPPGPPIAKSPENFAGQTGTTPTPGEVPAKATPNTTPPATPAKPSPPATPRVRPASK